MDEITQVTLEWLQSREMLGQNGDSFATSFQIYSYKTKIQFIFERVGLARVYVHQSNDDSISFDNIVLLGLVVTTKQVERIFREITKMELY